MPRKKTFTINYGDYRFSMSNFQVIPGHDDSLPYIGTLCLNGEELAQCHNDGWGGETNCQILDTKLYKEVLKILEDYPVKINTMRDNKPTLFTMENSISDIADKIACFLADDLPPTVFKYEKTSLMFLKRYRLKIMHTKPKTISIAINKQKSLIISVIKEEEKEGGELLNTNLTIYRRRGEIIDIEYVE